MNLTPDLLIHYDFLNRIFRFLHQSYAGKIFAIQELKTTFGFSRKYAIPLLEYLDKTGCTQRREDGPLWVAPQPPVIRCEWTLGAYQ